MNPTFVRSFHATLAASLRRPWQTFKDGQIWYGMLKSGSKRHPLTTKQGNKHFYKGTRSSGYGKLNKNGTYIMNWAKVRTYVVPADLQSTELRPLVSPSTPKVWQQWVGYSDGPKSVELAWKNIVDFVEHGENYDFQDLKESNYKEVFENPELRNAEIAAENDTIHETAEPTGTEKS